MRKKLILMILPVLILCLLTGCQPGFSCEAYGLPERTKICLLVKDPERSYPPENLKNTVIGDKSEDGWRYCGGIGNDPKTAKKLGSIKIAVYDDKGNILKISPEFPLVIEGRNYYWYKIAYNYKTNSIDGIECRKIDNFISRWVFRLFLIDFFCLITFVIVIASININNYRSAIWKMLLLNIPNIGIITLWGIDIFSDYYNPPGGDRFDYLDFCIIFIVIVMIINLTGIRCYIRSRRLAKCMNV